MYTVLVVDDSSDSLALINDILKREGISTLVALEGKQALTIAGQIKPDLILLDAVMPKMDGFETCRLLKASRELKHIPVIFMTGLTDSASILRGLNAGGVDYITKPVNPDELLARIKVHANNAHIASSAQQALDSMGQNIFAVNAQGEMLWATPQTHDFFSKINASDLWVNDNLMSFIKQLIDNGIKEQECFLIDHLGTGCEVCLVSHRASGDYIFRLNQKNEEAGAELLNKKLNLTWRESEVLYWLSKGKANKEIAQILDIGPRTVNKHLEQVFQKLGVENRTAAAGIAIRTLGSSASSVKE